MYFEFATATQIIFGVGALKDGLLHPAVSSNKRALIVTGSNTDRARPIIQALSDQGIDHSIYNVTDEPTSDIVAAGLEQARQADCDAVIGFGGGSALDTAKAIAILLTNGGYPLDYLEVIGQGKPFTKPGAPCIAIPTTAGTGTEVTRNAVLASPEHSIKVSLRTPYMLPALAIVDPELTLTLTPALTAATGIDALTQLLEAYVSNRANPLTDTICEAGIKRAARSLLTAYEHGDDITAREDMALAALFGGLALANAGLGAVHGFAGVIGGAFSASHGALCGSLLPATMAVNVQAVQAVEPDGDTLKRFQHIAQLITGSATATIQDGIAWIQNLCSALHIPTLSDYGVTEQDMDDIIVHTKRSSSYKKNPVDLPDDALKEILERSLGCTNKLLSGAG